MNKDFQLLCLLAVAAASPVYSVAELYRWKDDHGRVHYSDVKPRGGAAVKLDRANLSLVNSQVAPAEIPSRPSVKKARRVKPASDKSKRLQDGSCRQLKRQVARIDSQLSAGYREPQGNNLRQKRRKLQSRYWRQCH